ncbi:hypothetical protein [Cryptosporangium japonicum]|uniref:DUF2637 domain-containing protein n=1 Tax=Cryptosporangium japonicum TaxID=80872 RepID=A0ABN0UMS8_9ACTN
MSTQTLAPAGSAYPPAIESLVPQARELATSLGGVPSRNRLMSEFRIGAPKAAALREILTGETTDAPGESGGSRLHLVTEAAPARMDQAPATAPEPVAAPLASGAGHPDTATVSTEPAGVSAPDWENRVQVGLTVATGLIAFGGALGHAVQLAVAHGQNPYYATATAVLIETTALSATLELRRRRRSGQPIWLPVLVLILGAGLSLSVQIACAEHSAWGWILAAVPVIAFLVLMKFVLSRHPSEHQRNGDR